jgi:hypothetical protein
LPLGGAVSTVIVRAAARGISLNQDRSRLAEFGGPATLSKAWAVSLLKRMDFTKRRSTTKCSMPPENFTQEKIKFLQQIIDFVRMEDVPPELIWPQFGACISTDHGSQRVKMDGNIRIQ